MVTAADLSENMLLELSDDGHARPEGQLEGALSGFWTAHATRRQIGGAEWCFLAKPYYMATPLPAAGPMRSDLLEDDFTEDERSSPVDECSSPVDEHTTFIIPVATSAYHGPAIWEYGLTITSNKPTPSNAASPFAPRLPLALPHEDFIWQTHEMPAYKQYASGIRTAPYQALLRV
ncbi:hypothetical protein SCAR479_09786 [Seiridium cardinale]|uniref:Uncharacterized protein n=1 Tax=Seiridium cardinale TaxID=138064 RepID=A0ABR2XIE7_9PEZI